MLWEAKLTNGIGARIAHNTPAMSTKDALALDRILTSVSNAKQKKTTKIAQHKNATTTDDTDYCANKRTNVRRRHKP
jgi:hypothetical protein